MRRKCDADAYLDRGTRERTGLKRPLPPVPSLLFCRLESCKLLLELVDAVDQLFDVALVDVVAALLLGIDGRAAEERAVASDAAAPGAAASIAAKSPPSPVIASMEEFLPAL